MQAEVLAGFALLSGLSAAIISFSWDFSRRKLFHIGRVGLIHRRGAEAAEKLSFTTKTRRTQRHAKSPLQRIRPLRTLAFFAPLRFIKGCMVNGYAEKWKSIAWQRRSLERRG